MNGHICTSQKTHRLQIQRAVSWSKTRCGCRAGLRGAELIVFVCWVRPAGLSVCSLPGVEKGATQPWPAGLSCPQGAREQEAIARLHLQVVNLTSYCTDTSIIVIKGWSNIFIYWFPTGRRQGLIEPGVCTCVFRLDGQGEIKVHIVRTSCTTNIWWDIP